MPRVQIDYRTASKEVYNKFCLRYPEVKLSFVQWKEVIYTYNYFFRDYILETGDRARLPHGFGTFSISKKKSSKFTIHNGVEYINLPIDWKKTRSAGKRIYNLNTHTDGYRYRWYWFIKDARLYQSDIWVFKPSRSSSRKIAEYINKPSSIYSQLYKQWERSK